MHVFRAAVESGEFDTIGDLFAEDAVLHSPIAHRPYHGRDMIAAIICAVADALNDFHFVKEMLRPLKAVSVFAEKMKLAQPAR